jgi:predicted DNA-binding transcriptional regulator AlpA
VETLPLVSTRRVRFSRSLHRPILEPVNTTESDLVTRRVAAARLNCSMPAIDELLKERTPREVRLGGRSRRVDVRSIDALGPGDDNT